MSNTRKIILVASLVVAVGAGCFILAYTSNQNRNGAIYDDLRQQVTQGAQSGATAVIDIQLEGASATPQATPTSEPDALPVQTLQPQQDYVSPVDFLPLWQVNTDVYAWIEIPGTEVAYPILQSATDDSYYLNHTIEGVAGYPGSIYTESIHPKDFSAFNTVIYGHNMANRTMFGSLKDFRDETFFNEHRKIQIYTPDRTLTYTIYAAVLYSDDYLPAAYDSSTETGRLSFLESLRSIRNMNSHIAQDVQVDTDSKLITLSTCVGGAPNNRYLIVAVLDEENEE